jgi:hypothetical protein
MLSEVSMEDLNGSALEWKRHYKKCIKTAYNVFASERVLEWRIQGSPDARVKLYHDSVGHIKAQGEIYCSAPRLVALWSDLDFDRRLLWNDLFLGQGKICAK